MISRIRTSTCLLALGLVIGGSITVQAQIKPQSQAEPSPERAEGEAAGLADTSLEDAFFALEQRDAAATQRWSDLMVAAGAARDQGDARTAYDRGAQALQVLEQLGFADRIPGALTLQFQATLLSSQGAYDEAADLLVQTQAIWEARAPQSPRTRQNAVLLLDALRRASRWSDAARVNARELAIALERLGPDHPDVYEASDDQQFFLLQAAQYAEALEQTERLIPWSERINRADSVEVLALQVNRAISLDALGRSAEAVAVMQSALRASNVDAESRVGLRARNALAVALAKAGELAQADAILAELVPVYTRQQGSDSDDTLFIRQNRADLLYRMGRYDAAEQEARAVLNAREAATGPLSVETVRTLDLLSIVMAARGDYAEATELGQRAIAMATERLGERHPLSLQAASNLAATLRSAGMAEQAEPLMARMRALTAATYGETHPDTLLQSYNYAVLLGEDLGRYDEAIALHREVLAGQRAIYGDTHPDVVNSLTALATRLIETGQFAEADALLSDASTQAEALFDANHPVLLRVTERQSTSMRIQGQLLDAEPLLFAVLEGRRASLGETAPETLTTLAQYGQLVFQMGQKQEGLDTATSAYRGLADTLGRAHPRTLQQQLELAQMLIAARQPDVARTVLDRVLVLGADAWGARSANYTTAQLALASILAQQADLTAAEPLFQNAIRTRAELFGESASPTVFAQNQYGVALLDNGRAAEAEPVLARVYQGWTSAGETAAYYRRSAQANLAISRLQTPGREAEALPLAEELIAYLRDRNARLGGDLAANALAEGSGALDRRNFALYADARWASLDTPQAAAMNVRSDVFRALQDAMMGNTSRAVALQAARRVAETRGGEVAALAQEREALTAQWLQTEEQLNAAIRGSGEQSEDQRALLRVQQTAIAERQSAIDQRLQAVAPEYLALSRPQPVTVAQAQALLGPDEAALVIVSAVTGTHVVAVTSDDIVWHRAPLSTEAITERVAVLRQGLDQGMLDGGGFLFYRYAFDRQAAYSLYRELIAPVEQALDGRTHLYIAANGALTALPFGVLVTAEPGGDDDDLFALREETRWLNDSYALTQLPSLQSLQLIRQFGLDDTEDRSVTPFRGFGDPTLGGQSLSRGVGEAPGLSVGNLALAGTRSGSVLRDVSQLIQLSRLPGTRAELNALRTVLGAPQDSVVLGDAATETAVREADLSDARILAFATHGIVAGEIEGASEPGLVMTPPDNPNESDDGLLSASEIATLRLDADWVILSACNTAAGDEPGAPGLSGLARSFFFAGARSLLASHWPVRDDVAAALTVETLRRQRDDPSLSRAQALAQATVWLRNGMDDTDTEMDDITLAHPAAWAPFTLIGDAGRPQ